MSFALRLPSSVLGSSKRIASPLFRCKHSTRFYSSSSTQQLQGKSAVVTGSTAGIGLGIATALAQQGCNVMLNGFGEKKEIDKIVADLQKYNVKVGYDSADMSKAKEIRNLIQGATTAFGGVDILVNNAGIQHVAPVHEFPEEKWDAIIAINLSSAFHTMKAVIPQMKERGWGRIINIASVHGLVGSVNKAAYVAAKHGVVGLTKTTALELAGQGVTCNCINPGWTRTQLVEKQIEAKAQQLGLPLEEAARELLAEKQPSKQFVFVEQLANTAVFLCSDVASQITGISLPVDGGWTAQ